VAAAAAEKEKEKEQKQAAAGTPWKGLKFLSALAAKPSSSAATESKPTAAVVQERPLASAQGHLCYLALVSQSIKDIIHQWGHAANIRSNAQGKSDCFPTGTNGLIVQGGVEVFSCIGDKMHTQRVIQDPVGAIISDTDETLLTGIEVNSTSHNNMLYAAKYFPVLVG